MGYTGSIIVVAIIFSPGLLLAAVFIFAFLTWLRFLPRAVPGLINFALVSCLPLGALTLYGTIDMTIITPARLQRLYLGQVYASPWDLRSLEHQPHFMDPATAWDYQLRRDQTLSLGRQRCGAFFGHEPQSPDPPTVVPCVLHSHSDGRVIESATLDQAGWLRISHINW